MLTTEPAIAVASIPRSRITLRKAGLFAGTLVAAMFLVLAWGALHDAASAEVGVPPVVSAKKVATRQVSSATPPAAVAPTAKPSLTPSKSGRTTPTAVTTKPAPTGKSLKRRPATTPTWPAMKPAPDVSEVTAPPVAEPIAVATPTATLDGLPFPVRPVGTAPSATSAPPAVVSVLAAAPATATTPLKSTLIGTAAPGGEGRAISAAISALMINQCNGTDNAGGQAVACDVSVANHLDLSTGLSSSTVRVTQCHGAASAPLTCTTSTSTSNQAVTSVTQCEGSGSGGGGTVTCSVKVVNLIVGAPSSAPATINQCVGTGQGGGIPPTTLCTPTASATGATINQCNGSGNGGGASIRVQCTVGPSTQSAVLPVTVNQCNGSGNGGGATVTCSVSITNLFLARPGDVPPGFPPPGFPPDLPLPPGVLTPGVLTPGVLTPGVLTPGVLTPGVLTPQFFGPPLFGLPGVPGVPLMAPPEGSPPSLVAGPVLAAGLPVTGVDNRAMALLAVVAMLLGGLFVGLSRRRV